MKINFFRSFYLFIFFSARNILSNKKPIALISQVYIVPLPDFTVYPEKINVEQEKYWKIFLKLLKLLFWPRGHIHQGTKEKQEKVNLSPFMKMLRKDLKENSAEIYDNPSIAAVI